MKYLIWTAMAVGTVFILRDAIIDGSITIAAETIGKVLQHSIH